jgi:hypothetical protein
MYYSYVIVFGCTGNSFDDSSNLQLLQLLFVIVTYACVALYSDLYPCQNQHLIQGLLTSRSLSLIGSTGARLRLKRQWALLPLSRELLLIPLQSPRNRSERLFFEFDKFLCFICFQFQWNQAAVHSSTPVSSCCFWSFKLAVFPLDVLLKIQLFKCSWWYWYCWLSGGLVFYLYWCVYQCIHAHSDWWNCSISVSCPCRRLELLNLYREGRKPALVSKIVSDSVTLDYHIYPSFGRAVFMEFKVFVLTCVPHAVSVRTWALLCKAYFSDALSL